MTQQSAVLLLRLVNPMPTRGPLTKFNLIERCRIVHEAAMSLVEYGWAGKPAGTRIHACLLGNSVVSAFSKCAAINGETCSYQSCQSLYG